jgi:hypothetical protein
MDAIDGSLALPEGVSWTQDDESVEVTVAVDEGVVRSNLRVHTSADMLRVQQCVGEVWRPLLTGSLRQAVEAGSCCWALETLRKGGKAVVIQLEKQSSEPWDALLRASVAGSILQEVGRDQVIVDAGADVAESLVCGRCGALVKSSRMEAHMTIWCEALASGEAPIASAEVITEEMGRDAAKSPAAHLYWARSPTNPTGPAPAEIQLNKGPAPEGTLV